VAEYGEDFEHMVFMNSSIGRKVQTRGNAVIEPRRQPDLPWYWNNPSTWMNVVSAGILKITHMLRILLVVNHQQGSEAYVIFAHGVLYGISNIVDELGGVVYRAEENFPSNDYISRTRMFMKAVQEAAYTMLVCLRPGTFETEYNRWVAQGELRMQDDKKNPFFQWCNLYFSPTLGNYDPFVTEVHRVYTKFENECDQTDLASKRRHAIESFPYTWPPGYNKNKHAGPSMEKYY